MAPLSGNRLAPTKGMKSVIKKPNTGNVSTFVSTRLPRRPSVRSRPLMGNLKKEDGLLETSVGQCLPLPVSSSVFYGRARKSSFTVTNVGPLENLEAISNVKHGLERARKSSFIVTNVRSLENKEIYPNVKRVSGPAPVNSNFVISGDNRHIDAFVKELPGPIFYSHDMVEAFESHFVSLTKIGSSSSTSSLVLNLNVKVGMQFLHFYCQKHLGDAYGSSLSISCIPPAIIAYCYGILRSFFSLIEPFDAKMFVCDVILDHLSLLAQNGRDSFVRYSKTNEPMDSIELSMVVDHSENLMNRVLIECFHLSDIFPALPSSDPAFKFCPSKAMDTIHRAVRCLVKM